MQVNSVFGVATQMSKKSIIAVAAAASLVVAVLTLLPTFIRANTRSASNDCVNNLRQLDGAKQQWALNDHKGTNDFPTLEDLRPYLQRPLVCPQRGAYT